MFSGVILLCAALGSTDCIAVSGPAFETRKECKYNLQNQGIPYVKLKFQDKVIAGQRCVRWKNNEGA